MTHELTIAIAGIIGILIGLAIDWNARLERDQQIHRLEYELNVKQNIIDSNNDTINRLRRENDKLKKKNNNNNQFN